MNLYEGIKENLKEDEESFVDNFIDTSNFHCWEDFWSAGKDLGLDNLIDELDYLHEKYDGFKYAPEEQFKKIFTSINKNLLDYDQELFIDDMKEYFGWNYPYRKGR